MLPTVLSRVTAIELDDTPGDVGDDEVEVIETADDLDDHITDDGEVVDDDGLTLDQRLEGAVAEVEDRLPAGRGAVQGRVRDEESGEDLAGVTVVLTSPAMEGAQTAITDEHGFFVVANLPPGSYLVTFYYAEITVERSDVQVAAASATPVFEQLSTTTPPSRRPIVVYTDDFIEEIEEIEVIRNFHSDDNVDEISISSNCGSTNTYVIDGIDTTGLQFGDDDDSRPDPEDPDEETIE